MVDFSLETAPHLSTGWNCYRSSALKWMELGCNTQLSRWAKGGAVSDVKTQSQPTGMLQWTISLQEGNPCLQLMWLHIRSLVSAILFRIWSQHKKNVPPVGNLSQASVPSVEPSYTWLFWMLLWNAVKAKTKHLETTCNFWVNLIG